MSEALSIGIQAAEWDPAADLAVAFRRHMETLVRRNGPSANTRASSIGHDCERYLFYERTVPAELRVAHPVELQAIFELGRDFEKIAIRRLEDMGAEIVQRGRDYTERRYELSGHVDAKICMPGWARAVTAEIKGLNPYTGEKIATLEDIKNSRQAWVRKYYDQLQTYLFLDGSDLGVFVLFNKSTGWPTFIKCPLDYDHAEKLIEKAERTKLAVVKDVPPQRRTSADCQRCQFIHVCGPDVEMGTGATFLDDPEAEAKLARLLELEPAAAEYAALEKDIKAALPEKELVVIGDFAIEGKQVFRKAYASNVKAGSYWRREIRRLIKPK